MKKFILAALFVVSSIVSFSQSEPATYPIIRNILIKTHVFAEKMETCGLSSTSEDFLNSPCIASEKEELADALIAAFPLNLTNDFSSFLSNPEEVERTAILAREACCLGVVIGSAANNLGLYACYANVFPVVQSAYNSMISQGFSVATARMLMLQLAAEAIQFCKDHYTPTN